MTTATPARTRRTYPATPAQRDLVAKLLREIDPPSADAKIALAEAGVLRDKRETSTYITALIRAAKVARADVAADAPAPAAAEPGYYSRRDDVFLVVRSKNTGRTYAKRLTLPEPGSRKRATWDYAPGVGRSLAEEGLTPLTIAEASRLGHLHGYCVICGARLDDPKSVERGVGPVCVKRLGG